MSRTNRTRIASVVGLMVAMLAVAGTATANPLGDEVSIAVAFGQVQEPGFLTTVTSGVEYTFTEGSRGGTLNVDLDDGTLKIDQVGLPSATLAVTVSDIDWLDDNGDEIPGAIDGVSCTVTGGVVLNTVSWTEDSISITTLATPQNLFAIDCTYTVVHEPITPDGLIQELIEQVQVLVADQTLDSGNGNSLVRKLEGAAKNLTDGDVDGACGKLGAFINEVEAFVNTGKLLPLTGQELIDAATVVRELIPC